MADKTPKSPLILKSASIHRQNKAAIYYTLLLEDADGNLWTVQNANFTFDLKETPSLGEHNAVVLD